MVKKEKKPDLISRVEDKLSRAEIVIATDYRGLTVAETSALRQKLRDQGIEYQVVKNTLAGFAAVASGKSELNTLLKGPTALVFGYDDVTQPAKVLLDHQRSVKETPLSIKGGILAERLLTREEISALAKLPPKDELVAKFVGLVQSPIHGLLAVLSGNLRGFIGVLQARITQLEGE